MPFTPFIRNLWLKIAFMNKHNIMQQKIKHIQELSKIVAEKISAQVTIAHLLGTVIATCLEANQKNGLCVVAMIIIVEVLAAFLLFKSVYKECLSKRSS